MMIRRPRIGQLVHCRNNQGECEVAFIIHVREDGWCQLQQFRAPTGSIHLISHLPQESVINCDGWHWPEDCPDEA